MINAYLTDSATLIISGGLDEINRPLPGTPVEIKCRFEFSTKRVTGKTGDEVVAAAKVMLPQDREISHMDKIKFKEIEYTVIKIQKVKAFSKGFTEVYVK
ncbi:MAG: hypothetical protein KAW12_07240 [Candidatus Aminicenantes bacterium]|nr:hypothetical protein [Candidatus Aminicenantes bacterium]